MLLLRGSICTHKHSSDKCRPVRSVKHQLGRKAYETYIVRSQLPWNVERELGRAPARRRFAKSAVVRRGVGDGVECLP